jgi:FMN phosphatase YigB (HAD superfamily)
MIEGMRAGPIQAVVLDVDGTLYRLSAVRFEMARRLAGHVLRNPIKGLKTLRVIRAYRRAQEQLRGSGGNAAAQQIELAAAAAGCSKAAAEATIRQWMHEAPLDAVRRARYPGIEEFCRWATANGIALAVLSDYDPHAKLAALSLARYMKVVACAQDPDIGCFKPDPAGLRVVLAKLGVEPAGAAYVGDRVEVDGALATAAGVRGFLIGGAVGPGLESAATWAGMQALIAAAR